MASGEFSMEVAYEKLGVLRVMAGLSDQHRQHRDDFADKL